MFKKLSVLWILSISLTLILGCAASLPAEDESTDVAALFAQLEVPPHPRAAQSAVESQDEQASSAGVQYNFASALIPPPHPRVNAAGALVAGQDGLALHDPLPTRAAPLPTPTLIGQASGKERTDASTVVAIATATATVEPTAESTSVSTAVPTEESMPEPTPTAPLVTFYVHPEESTVSYQVYEEFAASDSHNLVTGKTQQVEGELTISLSEQPNIESGFFKVDIASLTSLDPRRDVAIQNEWLETAQYPSASFEIIEIRNGPNVWQENSKANFQMAGDLTIRGTTNEVLFDVSALLADGTIRATATANILMTDYGFEPPSVLNFVSAQNEVTLIVYLTAVQEES